METWMYILIAVVIIIFFLYKKMKNALGMPVLETQISTENGLNYHVSFKKLHPEMKSIEYVRLVLNFIAKTIFIIENKHEYVRTEILDFIEDASRTDLTGDELKRLVPIELNFTENDIHDGKTIKGILYFSSTTIRNIFTKLPLTWFEYQLFHSIIALLIITCEKLDEEHRNYLKDSLIYMSNAYKSGSMNPSSGIVMQQLPNESFLYRNS